MVHPNPEKTKLNLLKNSKSNFYLSQILGLEDEDVAFMGEDGHWPSMQDLNTRLRRVITSYQRNYKKEELKQQQKAKVNKTNQFFFVF